MLQLSQQGIISGAGGGGGGGGNPLTKLQNYWECGDTIDSHGTADVTLTSVTYGTGLIGNAWDTNGGQIQTPDGAHSSTGNFSLAMWVYFDTRSANDYLCWNCWHGSSGAYVPGDWMLIVNGSNQVQFYMSVDGTFNSSAGDTVLTSAHTVGTGAWHFVVITFDSTSKLMQISVDNNTLESTTHTGTYYNAGDVLRFGRLTETYVHAFDGRYDCVGYFTDVLTQDEVTWLYNSGAGRAYADF